MQFFLHRSCYTNEQEVFYATSEAFWRYSGSGSSKKLISFNVTAIVHHKLPISYLYILQLYYLVSVSVHERYTLRNYYIKWIYNKMNNVINQKNKINLIIAS